MPSRRPLFSVGVAKPTQNQKIDKEPIIYIDKDKNCPLQSLSDYTKQVRKEVVKEIKEKLKGKEIFHPEDEFEIDYDFYYKEDVEEILDQLQGE